MLPIDWKPEGSHGTWGGSNRPKKTPWFGDEGGFVAIVVGDFAFKLALVGEKRPGGEIVDERFVYRCACELELGDLLGERQLGAHASLLASARCVV